MKYKVETKEGKIYKAQDVELAFGFLTMKFWNGETRLPSGEISSIKRVYLQPPKEVSEKSPKNTSGDMFIPIFLFVLVFLFTLPILLFLGG